MKRERGLAPVTYLPGARPSSEVRAEPADEARAEAVRIETAQIEAAQIEAAQAEAISLGTLGRRGTSVRELETKLRDKGLSEPVIDHELTRLQRVGLLDDVALAEELVRRLVERKGQGRTAIAAELRRRALDPLAIETALASLDGDDELQRAVELAEKRSATLTRYDRETAVRRLSGYLQRKGYGGDIVRHAVAHALAHHRTSSSGVRFH